MEAAKGIITREEQLHLTEIEIQFSDLTPDFLPLMDLQESDAGQEKSSPQSSFLTVTVSSLTTMCQR